MKTASSTPNCFMFLELGILPIKYEIQIRQLAFLHHILNLPEHHPVLKIYNEQKCYPFAKNWANSIHSLIELYNLPQEDIIKKLTRNKWKGIVQSCINNTVQNQLKIECKTMKKTSALSFISPFRISQYLVKYPSDVAIMLFRIRSNSTNCAVN